MASSESSARSLVPSDLLRTKLTAPQPATTLLRRDALLARLDDAARMRLTLVSAPAGFGKTTLVAQWLNSDAGVDARRHRGWLSLDSDDNDPVRFWRYVVAAFQLAGVAVGARTLATLRPAPASGGDASAVLLPLLNDLTQSGTGNARMNLLVLEDYHVITAMQIHETLAFLVDHLPETTGLMVLTRGDPPLPLARWRARDQLRELRAVDLRFTRIEAEAFARATLGAELSSDAVARLDHRLEGFPAGWRMLSLIAQWQPGDVERLASNFDGAHQHVIEYFAGEVLGALPPLLQEFVLRTSLLNRMTGSLCDAVTGRDDGEATLDQLERDNVFVERLNVERGSAWYRYHGLFSDAMRHVARRRLGEEALRGLLVRASAWFERNGDLSDAIETALDSRDSPRAAALIEQYVERRRYQEAHTLRRWLDQLPQADVFARPELCRSFASLILFTEDRYAPATRSHMEPYLAQAERLWRAQAETEKLGELLALRSMMEFWQGDYAENSRLAREALALLPESNADWRGVCLLQVTGEELHAGRLVDLLPVALEARALCAASANPHAALAALTALGEVCYWRGESRQAALYSEQVLEEAPVADHASDHQRALTLLALIALDRNEIGQAAEHAARAVALGSQPDEPDSMKHAMLLRLRIQHAAGETTQAHDALRQFIAAEHSPTLGREAHLARAHLEWLDGDAAAAQRTLGSLPAADATQRLDQEAEALLRARLMLSLRASTDALRLSVEWRDDARQNERTRSELEWALLESLAHAQRDDLPHARLAFSDALAVCQREGITRPFIELAESGAPLVALLRDHLASPGANSPQVAACTAGLLEAMHEPAAAQATGPAAIEPLSAQERRVLRLLVAGMTNAEIARELTVSVNTVKTQTQSIYRKLNVKGRDEAREVARRMKLI
jgi:LuxR family maltose regulon positive regulatory protein